MISLAICFWIGACTPRSGETARGPEADPDAREASDKGAPEGEAPDKEAPEKGGDEGETVELEINVQELHLEDQVVWFEPDSGVRRARYTRYAFDRNEFERVVGTSSPTENLTLVIRITQTRTNNVVPAISHAQSPEGGFDITIHHAKIIRVR